MRWVITSVSFHTKHTFTIHCFAFSENVHTLMCIHACVNTLANTHIHAQNHSIHNVCIILLLSRKNSDRTLVSVCLCGKSSICPAEVSCCESPPPAGCSIVPDLMMQGRGEVNSLFRMSGSVTLAL